MEKKSRTWNFSAAMEIKCRFINGETRDRRKQWKSKSSEEE
jgi:hypothetical protein